MNARSARGCIRPPSEQYQPFGLQEAYGLAASVAAGWRSIGNRSRGIKIGLTYRPAWEKLGLSHPVWAPVYEQGIVDGEVAESDLVSPRIEAEVVLALKEPLAPGATRAEVARAVEWAALSFEIVDCHFPEWKLTPPDLVADFGCHAGLAVGEPVRVDLAASPDLAQLEVSLTCDGDHVASGSGRDVLGGPIECLQELLAAPGAPSLASGDLIATGALTGRAHPVSAGQTWLITAGPSSPFRPAGLRIVP
ncbi:MAG TPA: fumarylacetoacetate hydrolase family protein [Jatrophihabitantaceae bacterium]|nr:fumarylacetoacetate hydrolase family protein [Jatrophihabitantaceae bacterium]